MHAASKAFSSTSTIFNPYFGWYIIYMQNTPAKVMIKSCRLLDVLEKAIFLHAFGFEI